MWQSLPPDELDDQLDVLKRDFQHLGRHRAWFRGFDRFVNEVLALTENFEHAGANESSVRVLQSDFLAEMETRFWLYCHYQQLRTQYGAMFASRFSFFESDLAELARQGASEEEFDQYLRQAITSIESEVKRQRDGAIVKRNGLTKLLEIDHGQRLTEWATFQDRQRRLSVKAQFNELMPILSKNPEWAKEAKLFKSAVKEKRSHSPGRENGRAEARDIRRFIKRMCGRVDAELAIDVAYRILEQDLIRNHEYLDELVEFKQELAREIWLQRPLKERRTDKLKREFVKRIWERRGVDSISTGTVTPLLPGRTGS